MTETIVRAARLSRFYGEVRALEDVDLDVARGEWVGVMGPSGSGKTTLLNILGGLDRPTSGQLHVDGTDVMALLRKELARFRRETVGLVFGQDDGIAQDGAREVGEHLFDERLAVGRQGEEVGDGTTLRSRRCACRCA